MAQPLLLVILCLVGVFKPRLGFLVLAFYFLDRLLSQ